MKTLWQKRPEMVFHALGNKDLFNALAVVEGVLANYFQGLTKGYFVKVDAALECPGADNRASGGDIYGFKLPAVNKGRFPDEKKAFGEFYADYLPAFGKGAVSNVGDCAGKVDLLTASRSLVPSSE